MEQNTRNDLDNVSCSKPNFREGLTYLLIGGGIGATLALLFAPKAGSQFRSDIADMSRKGYDAALDKARVLNEKTGELAHTVKEEADAAYDFAKQKAGALIETFTEKSESARSAVEDIVSDKSNKVRDLGESIHNRVNVS